MSCACGEWPDVVGDRMRDDVMIWRIAWYLHLRV